MKTLTEFAPIVLKNAAKTKAELVTAGKTPEELPAAMGEALKIEGDKLTHLLNLLDIVGDRMDDLKRGLALAKSKDDEKVSDSIKTVGEHFYSIEYFPPVPKKLANGRIDHGRGERGGRGGRDDKRGGKGGRDKKGRGGGGRRDGRPGRDGERSAGGAPGGDGNKEGRGGFRGPRKPRAPRPPVDPNHKMTVVLPKKKTEGAPAAASTETSASTENSTP